MFQRISYLERSAPEDDRFQCNLEEDDMGYKEDQEMLRKVGFTKAEINRLSTLRRNLAEECKYIELVNYRRLLFVRWLVMTGRLTE